jgi:hypothetical protein
MQGVARSGAFLWGSPRARVGYFFFRRVFGGRGEAGLSAMQVNVDGADRERSALQCVWAGLGERAGAGGED